MALQIYAKTTNGFNCKVKVNEDDTINKLKEQIKDQLVKDPKNSVSTSSSPKNINILIIFMGKILKDDQTIKSCGIRDESTVIIFERKCTNDISNSSANTPINTQAPVENHIEQNISPFVADQTNRQHNTDPEDSFTRMMQTLNHQVNMSLNNEDESSDDETNVSTNHEHINESPIEIRGGVGVMIPGLGFLVMDPNMLRNIQRQQAPQVQHQQSPQVQHQQAPQEQIQVPPVQHNINSLRGNQSQIGLSSYDITRIDRIVDMGFSPQSSVEAYLACDRNQEAAVEFLLSNVH